MFLNPNTSPEDTVGDLKKLVAAQTGTRADKIVLKKWWVCYIIPNVSSQSWHLSYNYLYLYVSSFTSLCDFQVFDF